MYSKTEWPLNRYETEGKIWIPRQSQSEGDKASLLFSGHPEQAADARVSEFWQYPPYDESPTLSIA
jgi:hypothetical protein